MILMLVAIVAAASPNLGRDGQALNARSAEFDARMVVQEVRLQSQSQRRSEEEKPDPELFRFGSVARSRVDSETVVAAQCRGTPRLGELTRAGLINLPPPAAFAHGA